uniref:Uncharacterized protein n=1 Tax=Polytomella parva TaxID=51329 RepID=A0A7S0YCV1_9CHLO|mmetsp:Transcript_18317/g.33394  ORF Transcript_18317/g.33394 Transcript_18317/m.33394 type:complete len:725 (+) Transcript_18317:178-2352(+)|eukprot:CAMPEP_0175048972 /NCGR_PEP_ID=MMETSP0052_2-20121109/6486_1 /TAXON_ID=51329 ORGANISM="Polytomella parva, Strain SAG 63-3" /NCGR_SAMPLE_ID=MMETSP0052_2 /ASSEMBLY_ACC=CAM_ASM_000194 /LENGTH=724 /DNA_ID=CAMNT_0016313095 /DNA_START=120 /DNA_END=2294 /DNA_ORIENTATION=-
MDGFEAASLAEVPDFAVASDFGDSFEPANAFEPVIPFEEVYEGSIPPVVPTGVYLVRVPRPVGDDKKIKDLIAKLQPITSKLKENNSILAGKRDDLAKLRQQLEEAMALKEGSQPAFSQRSKIIQELRTTRDQYNKTMNEVKEAVGFVCKSEEELDAKIKSLEDRIAHENIPMREEKSIVLQISKLKQKRPLIRQFETQVTYFEALEVENKAALQAQSELDGQGLALVKEERDRANALVRELYQLVRAAREDLQVTEGEQRELEAQKNAIRESLDAAREESSDSGYKENQEFTLYIRELLLSGHYQEAQEQCSQQIDDLMSRLSSDAAFRADYQKHSASLRRFPVSDVLLESSIHAAPSSNAARSVSTGRGGRNASASVSAASARDESSSEAASAAAEVSLKGREKAKQLIEQLRAMARDEVQGSKKETSSSYGKLSKIVSDDGWTTVVDAKAVVMSEEQRQQAVAERVASTKRSKALAAEVSKMQQAPLGVSEPEEFELPTYLMERKKAEEAEALKKAQERAKAQKEAKEKKTKAQEKKEALDREMAREEARKKQEEEDARKKELAAAREKKWREGEAKRKQEEAKKKQEQEAAASVIKSKAEAAAAKAAKKRAAADAAAIAAGENTGEDGSSESERVSEGREVGGGAKPIYANNLRNRAKMPKPAVLPVAKSQLLASARKAPKAVDTPMKKLKRFVRQNAPYLTVAVVVLLILLILTFALNN